MSNEVMFVFLGVVTFFNIGGAVAIGRVIKNYGSLSTKVDEHDRILHDGIIGKLDNLSEGQAEMRGELRTYMKMKT